MVHADHFVLNYMGWHHFPLICIPKRIFAFIVPAALETPGFSSIYVHFEGHACVQQSISFGAETNYSETFIPYFSNNGLPTP